MSDRAQPDPGALPFDSADASGAPAEPPKRAPSSRGKTPPSQSATLVEPARPDSATEMPSWQAEELDGETFVPIHQQVRLSERELRVVDHPAVQRLFEFRQLGQANLVFRGATHARGEHAIGTLEAADLFVRALARNNRRGKAPSSDRNYRLGTPLTPVEIAFVRLGGLLHDIGHLPVGHTLEDELGLLDQHDANARLNTVLDNRVWHGLERPTLRSLLDSEFELEAAESGILNSSGGGLSGSEVLLRLISREHADERLPQAPEKAATFRYAVLRDIIGNTLCADILDYLHRDWYHIGRPRFMDKRMLDYVEIRTNYNETLCASEHKLVLNLGTYEKPRHDAVTMTVDLLESRYQLAEIVLFHRTKLIAAAMLERALAEYQDSFGNDETGRANALSTLEQLLLQCDDQEAYTALADLIHDRSAAVNGLTQLRLSRAEELLRRLRVRELHKEVASFWSRNLAQSPWVQECYAADPKYKGLERTNNRRTTALNRLLAARDIEEDFDLPPCSVVMYCPSAGMNSKIAQVQVFQGNSVQPLSKLEKSFTGGQLDALDERFRQLWRVTFAMDRAYRDELASKSRLDVVRDAIRFGPLNEPLPDGRDELDELLQLRDIAARIYGDDNVLTQAEIGSGKRMASWKMDAGMYASERPTLRSFRR